MINFREGNPGDSERYDAHAGVNNESRAMAQWFQRPAVLPALVRITHAWNGLELLGIDLADQIEALARRTQSPPRIDFDVVDWGWLAERCAYEFCGVTEHELTRRRVAAGGTP